ncbi:MAG: hypothetical protein Q9159_001291 [Coniocarpon cinnabarinum]
MSTIVDTYTRIVSGPWPGWCDESLARLRVWAASLTNKGSITEVAKRLRDYPQIDKHINDLLTDFELALCNIQKGEDVADDSTALEELFAELTDIADYIPSSRLPTRKETSSWQTEIEKFPRVIDVNHVADKFPKASKALVDRLGDANRERRARLSILKATNSIREDAEHFSTARAAAARSIAPSDFHDSGIGSSIQSRKDLRKTGFDDAVTPAHIGDINVSDNADGEISEEESVGATSYAPTAVDVEDGPGVLTVPSPPKDYYEKSEFVCPLFQNTNDVLSHVALELEQVALFALPRSFDSEDQEVDLESCASDLSSNISAEDDVSVQGRSGASKCEEEPETAFLRLVSEFVGVLEQSGSVVLEPDKGRLNTILQEMSELVGNGVFEDNESVVPPHWASYRLAYVRKLRSFVESRFFEQGGPIPAEPHEISNKENVSKKEILQQSLKFLEEILLDISVFGLSELRKTSLREVSERARELLSESDNRTTTFLPDEEGVVTMNRESDGAGDTQSRIKASSYPILSTIIQENTPDGKSSTYHGLSTISHEETRKKHKCPHCGTEFTRHHNLRSHLLTHTQENPYECNRCEQKFRRLHDLKRHTKLHTGEEIHNCAKCGRSFEKRDALLHHQSGPDGCAGLDGNGDGQEDRPKNATREAVTETSVAAKSGQNFAPVLMPAEAINPPRRRSPNNYSGSWGGDPQKTESKNRVLSFWDGGRRLEKDEMHLHADHEVRLPLPSESGDGAYITDSDAQTLSRVGGLLNATDESRGQQEDVVTNLANGKDFELSNVIREAASRHDAPFEEQLLSKSSELMSSLPTLSPLWLEETLDELRKEFPEDHLHANKICEEALELRDHIKSYKHIEARERQREEESERTMARIFGYPALDTQPKPPIQSGPRRFRKRVKTGCLTCRKRRIKCDEERPSCSQCARSKRECDWSSRDSIFVDPVQKTPVQEVPVQGTVVQGTVVQGTVVQETFQEAPVQEAPVQEAPVQEAPVQEAPVQEAPVQEAPVREAPVQEAPVQETPVQEAPVQETPVPEAPLQ